MGHFASGSGSAPSDLQESMSAALLKLTQIASLLTEKKSSASKVEAVLDGVHSTGLPDVPGGVH